MTNQSESPSKRARIFYARTDEFWRKGEKYAFLDEKQHVGGVEWQELQPDAKHNWLTEGLRQDFETFVPIAKSSDDSGEIFRVISNGVQTNRDAWVYNFNREILTENAKRIIETYNDQVYKWHREKKQGASIDSFVSSDDREIKWSSRLKERLAANVTLIYAQENIRHALYRPFTVQHVYFDDSLIHRPGQFPQILPISSAENRLIWLKVGGEWPMFALMVEHIADQLPSGGSQCFPFYTYDEDGTNRCENITDWALEKFRAQYGDASISKWDIFHYVYAVLHHPAYRERYAANLKRELPRIPYAPPPQLSCLCASGHAARRVARGL